MSDAMMRSASQVICDHPIGGKVADPTAGQAHMPLCSIAYCSDAAAGLTVDQLNALVRDASSHNRISGVTGVLLCDGNRFLQYIEGPDDGVDHVYSRIVNARSHRGITELGRGRGGVRRFPYWSMRWIPVESHELHCISMGHWASIAECRSESDEQPEGVALLKDVVMPHIQVDLDLSSASHT